MMAIVIVFIILNIPRMILALYEVSTIPDIIDCYKNNCYYYLSSNRWMMDIVVRYLVMLNSSINFIIYCFVGSKFRNTLKKIFLKEENSVTMRSRASSIASNHITPHISVNNIPCCGADRNGMENSSTKESNGEKNEKESSF